MYLQKSKKFLFTFIIFLSACSQAEQSKPNFAQENIDSHKNLEHSKISMNHEVDVDQPLAVFAVQQTVDELLANNCIWTDDPNAEGKLYWAISPSSTMNGKSQFSQAEIYPQKVKLGKPIKNCNEIFEKDYKNYAYTIDQSGDLVNFIALKIDRMKQNSDHTYSIDLNKNGKPEKLYVCYNMESLDVFFIESSSHDAYLEHVNVELSFAIDGEIDEEITCGSLFYKKSGILAQENPKTGEYEYSVQ